MTASWNPRLRHLVDSKVQAREDVSSGAAANSTRPRRDVAALVPPSVDFGGNSPAHALGQSELAYDLGPVRQAEDDAWQPQVSTSQGARSDVDQAGGGVPWKGDRVGANKKKQQQTRSGADGGWNSTDLWSSKSTSKEGWDAAQTGWWAGDESRAVWPPAVQVGADENAHKKSSLSRSPKEQKQQPLRQQGKAAPYATAAAVAADSAGAATGAPGGAEVPSEAKGKFGKKVARKDVGLRWVEKDAVFDQPSKDKANNADSITEQAGDHSGEAVKQDVVSHSKQRPVLQWRAAGRGRGRGNGGDVQDGEVSQGEAVKVSSRSRGRARRAGK